MTEQIDYRPPSRSFSKAIQTCLSNYINFNGRASRSEYWWFFLFCFIVAILAAVYGEMDEEIDGDMLFLVAWLVLLPPSLAVGAR